MVASKGQVVALLFAISLFNYIDRWSVAGIINDLQAPPDKGGFGLTDAEGGLVTSVFIITYMSLSPVFGYFGDRVPRVPLLFFGVLGWSVAGLFASFSQYYWQFLAFRAMVGIGEASYSVLAPTIIADLYTGTERTRVLGLYSSSIPLGAAMGYIYAGEVARMLDWRWAFRITPFFGVVLASVLLCFVTEPARGDSDGIAQSNSDSSKTGRSGFSGFIRDAVDIWRVPSFFWSTWGAVGMTFTAGALAQWASALLQRFNCDSSDSVCEAVITRTFGIITIIAGVGGCILGPQLSKVYSKKDPAGDAYVSGLSLLFATPFVFLAIYFSPSQYTLTWFLILIGETLVSFTWPLLAAIQLSVVPPSQRNTANGISLTISHILGDSVSPLAIGLVADRMHDGGKGVSRAVGLQRALYFCVTASFIAGFFFIVCGWYLHKDRIQALSHSDGRYEEVTTNDGEVTVLDDEELDARGLDF
eukprot:TRINITY_DN387_c0_g1_i2.p1 TRINITY_DN387_c0_g1~~TRINITY_DN387_c0_g1_i2.p1  ORF type:complete len:473 (+),score=20.26 TRINITY_DN387_c0_g1_i2:202-1620(+)